MKHTGSYTQGTARARVRQRPHTWMPEVSIKRAISPTFSTSAQKQAHTVSLHNRRQYRPQRPTGRMYYSPRERKRCQAPREKLLSPQTYSKHMSANREQGRSQGPLEAPRIQICQCLTQHSGSLCGPARTVVTGPPDLQPGTATLSAWLHPMCRPCLYKRHVRQQQCRLAGPGRPALHGRLTWSTRWPLPWAGRQWLQPATKLSRLKWFTVVSRCAEPPVAQLGHGWKNGVCSSEHRASILPGATCIAPATACLPQSLVFEARCLSPIHLRVSLAQQWGCTVLGILQSRKIMSYTSWPLAQETLPDEGLTQ